MSPSVRAARAIGALAAPCCGSTGHWEWHSLAAYVVFPREGEPTLVYGMGGTHIEAVRRETAAAISDVRSSRNGRYGEVMAERIRELGLERGRIGLLEIDARHEDYLPVNQYNDLKKGLPEAEIVFTKGIMHELLSVHSAEELDCIRKAGKLCTNAMQAIAERARPGVDRIRAQGGRRLRYPGGRRRHRLPRSSAPRRWPTRRRFSAIHVPPGKSSLPATSS